MSMKVVDWVFHESTSTGNARLVLLAIADEANDEGDNAFPSIKRIAKKARIPERTCLRCIETLESLGELEVTRPETRGRGRFNTYRVVPKKGAISSPFPDSETVRNGDSARRGKVRNGAPVVPDRVVDPLTLIDPTTISRPPDAFERFWKVYPRRVDKRAALKAWRSATKRADHSVIIRGATFYAEHVAGSDPKFVKYPATWLNADAWLNEYDDPDEEPRVVEY